ncbi:hypothetical protein HF329_33325 [Chitinophaga oryzae]|uniref:HhH-GPD domain-containing protein n=1 Tax=Chitinophaga oryzae TaxID=2725414 RepID=A0AAE6ZMG5_9BACT|nr:hypothetical protein [Chitinophaga oryzae]QJB35931.1 hypothetical protein HF329_33325 [Chitinophaga oryzae]
MCSEHILESNINRFQVALLIWYKFYGRHNLPWRKQSLSSYEIVIAEVLLQRTKAETINKYYQDFISTFPNWEAIVKSSLSFLENKLRSIGLYRQRAQRLKNLAIEMVRRNGEFPQTRSSLELMPFLGQYIVNAILLQIFNQPTPLLDVNMSRVLERYFGNRQLSDIRYDPYLQDLAYRVVNHKDSKIINWAILDFAAEICTARKPQCEKCLLSATCQFVEKTLI